MSDPIKLALIGVGLAVLTCIQTIVLAYIAYLSRRTEKNTNGMKDQLVASTAKASHAEGVAYERARAGNTGVATDSKNT